MAFSLEGIVTLQEGSNTVVVAATNTAGNTASITSTITYIPNKLVLSCANISVDLDAHSSSLGVDYQIDSDSNCDSPATVSCSKDSGSLFTPGTTTVSCTAQNSCGAQASCEFSVKVNQQLPPPPPVNECDGSAEQIEQQLELNSLMSANHKMVEVGFNRSASDDCGEAVADQNLITQVWSNEPEIFITATGGGNTAPDASHTQGDLQLRAERFGHGNGRVYLLITKVQQQKPR
jgi:hypothetical protein